MNDEFYIGWEAKASPGVGRAVRRAVVVLFVIALLVPLALALSQRMIGAAVFEWGDVKDFSGVFESKPYPHLLVPRPGDTGPLKYSTYYLVAPWKFGLPAATARQFDGRSVTLKGTLIYRGSQTMIEVVKDSVMLAQTNAAAAPVPETVALGRQTLTGEIVDSKCFLGVMNPGQLAPHRACAIRCLSGGVPPVFLVQAADGTVTCFLLVDTDGAPVNSKILDFVAEPLQITGDVEMQDGLLILRAGPNSIKRL